MISGARTALRALTRECPVCAGGEGRPLHHQRFVLPEGHPLGSGYDVVCCSGCGAAFADTVTEQAAYDAFYAEFSKYDSAELSTGSGAADFDLIRLRDTAERIAGHVDRDARVLDIGCATGGLLHELQLLGFKQLVGVDPSAACVQYGRDQFELEMHQGTLADLPDIGQFDLVIVSHVLEHVERVGEAIGSIASVLAPAGRVYVEVPDPMRYRELLVAPFQDFSTEHINHFSDRALSNIAAVHGLSVEAGGALTIEATEGVPYPARWQLWQEGQTPSAPQFDHALAGELGLYVNESAEMLAEQNGALTAVLDQPVIVWGTGQLALKLLAETVLGDAEILCFIDGNPVFHGKRIAGVPVRGPEVLSDFGCPVVIASTIHRVAIERRIRDDLGAVNELITL